MVNKKGQSTQSILLIFLAFILLIISTSLGIKTLNDVNNSYGDNTLVANITSDFGNSFQTYYSDLFPVIGLIIGGIVLLFLFNELFGGR